MFLSDVNGLAKEAELEKQQAELQSKILSVLGDQPKPTGAPLLTPALAAVGSYGEIPSAASSAVPAKKPEVTSPPIDLNSPNVQQALNSLITSGGNSILQSLQTSVAGSLASSQPSATSSYSGYQ